MYLLYLNTYIVIGDPHFSIRLGFFSFQPMKKLDKKRYISVATSLRLCHNNPITGTFININLLIVSR